MARGLNRAQLGVTDAMLASFGEAHRFALALDLGPVEAPYRIAFARLQVVAHLEHRLAEGGEQRVGDAQLLARHAASHFRLS